MRYLLGTLATLFTACYYYATPPPNNPNTYNNNPGYSTGQPNNGGYTGTGSNSYATSRVSVNCGFEGSWAALVPDNVWRNDEFAMQALIGLSTEPSFWGNEYGYLQPYAAKQCYGQAWFDVAPGRYILVVGQTYDYYNRRVGGGYGYSTNNFNGYQRWVQIPTESSWNIGVNDLNVNWVCISCPHIYVQTDAGWEYRGEIIKDVIGLSQEQSQRTPIGQVKVKNGVVTIKVAEEQQEVSHLNTLLLEINGKAYSPDSGLLQKDDASYLTLKEGDSLELSYRVDLPDGAVSATVVAKGYYIPLVPLR